MADPAEALAAALRRGDVAAVRALLTAHRQLSQHGGTPLHWAAWLGNAAMARDILTYSPPLEAKDEAFDDTPLAWALYGSVHSGHCAGDYPGVVRVLLDAGAVASAVTGELRASDEVRAVLLKRQ